MSKPNDINLNTYEKMASMKNMFGNSIIEILKPNIKSHQNESVFKMLEIAKDKPETYMELLSVAIFHKNFEIIKYMVEKFKITEGDSPFMNALSFYNSILPENLKLTEPKENYNLIQCPFSIMCAIGGDVDIFKYLSKKNLISNKNETGIIGLSKKLKNAFYSNMVGAACYYGRTDFLEYILKNYKLDINIQTTEKKSKSGLKMGFSKEYQGLYPPMLGVVSDISDDTTVKILKILNNYNCKLKNCDNNKDNIIHLATKNKKILTVKYLIDELNLNSLLNENNKDGYTPLSLAQHLNNEIFINYFSDREKINEKEVEENVKELIEESNQIKDKNEKKKKKKNKNNDEPALLNSTEYEETLKEEKPNKNKNKKKKYNYSNYNNNYNNKETKEEEEEYNQYEENNDNNYNKEDNNNNKYISSQNKEKLRALLEDTKPKKKKKKDNDNKNVITYIEKKEEIKVEIKKEDIKEISKEKEIKEIKENNNTYSQENDDEFIIGLGSKNKKNKKFKKNYKEEKEKEKEEKMKLQLQEEEKKKKEEEERIKKEKEIEEQRIKEEEEKKLEEERQKEEERLRKIQEQEELIRKQKYEEEQKQKELEKEKEKERLRKIQEQEELIRKQKQEEEAKQRQLKELQEKQALEKEKEKEKNESNEEKEESEEDEDYSSEKNFLSEHEESKEKDESQKYVSKEDYNNLSKKYLELERRISVLEKEKEEMSSLLRNLFLQNKKNKQIPLTENKEEKINDLMKLANDELEKKNNIINNLQGKVAILNLDNINEFSKDKLKEYKDFYNKKLKTINDALKPY